MILVEKTSFSWKTISPGADPSQIAQYYQTASRTENFRKFSIFFDFSNLKHGRLECRHCRCYTRFSESIHSIKTCRKRIFDCGSQFFGPRAEKNRKSEIWLPDRPKPPNRSGAENFRKLLIFSIFQTLNTGG